MEIILIVYLVVSIALIGIILLQQGKGAEMGASFGAGGANTVFGASGSGNVLTKSTTILAILFFSIALAISYMNSESVVATDEVLDIVPASEEKNTKGLESQLPQSEGGIESQAAPAEEKAVKTEDLKDSVKAKADEVKAKAEEAKAKAEEKVDTAAEEKKDETEN